MKHFLRTTMMVLALAALVGAGAMKVEASAGCRQFVRVYREKLVHHRVTKATAAKWAEWNKAHPNYHPKPHPRMGKTTTETLRMMNVACEVEPHHSGGCAAAAGGGDECAARDRWARST